MKGRILGTHLRDEKISQLVNTGETEIAAIPLFILFFLFSSYFLLFFHIHTLKLGEISCLRPALEGMLIGDFDDHTISCYPVIVRAKAKGTSTWESSSHHRS